MNKIFFFFLLATAPIVANPLNPAAATPYFDDKKESFEVFKHLPTELKLMILEQKIILYPFDVFKTSAINKRLYDWFKKNQTKITHQIIIQSFRQQEKHTKTSGHWKSHGISMLIAGHLLQAEVDHQITTACKRVAERVIPATITDTYRKHFYTGFKKIPKQACKITAAATAVTLVLSFVTQPSNLQHTEPAFRVTLNTLTDSSYHFGLTALGLLTIRHFTYYYGVLHLMGDPNLDNKTANNSATIALQQRATAQKLQPLQSNQGGRTIRTKIRSLLSQHIQQQVTDQFPQELLNNVSSYSPEHIGESISRVVYPFIKNAIWQAILDPEQKILEKVYRTVQHDLDKQKKPLLNNCFRSPEELQQAVETYFRIQTANQDSTSIHPAGSLYLLELQRIQKMIQKPDLEQSRT